MYQVFLRLKGLERVIYVLFPWPVRMGLSRYNLVIAPTSRNSKGSPPWPPNLLSVGNGTSPNSRQAIYHIGGSMNP